MKKNKKPTSQAQSNSPSLEPTREDVAICAYLLWEQEGRPDGRHEVHWVQAEAQLRQGSIQEPAKG